MIRVDNLHKRYGEIRAVAGVSFHAEAGEIYGLLGPNGAGKTTTLSMLSGLLAPDEGRIVVDGVDLAHDPLRVKAQMGTVPQETALYEELTARENLRFWAGLYGLGGAELTRAVDAALDRVGLAARADSKAREFSGGMKRRLNLAIGLAHRPRLLLLDEPTVGIDPQARQNILDVVRDVAASGTTVIYTTHYLEEAERLCDRIGIIDQGKIIAEGTLDELERRVGGEEVVTVRGEFSAEEARSQVAALPAANLIGAEDGRLVVGTTDSGRGAVELLTRVLGGSLAVEAVSIQPPGLNGLFLKLTGRELRD